MGYSSQPGHVIFRSQTDPGILEPDLGAAGIAMKLRSGNLGTNRDLMIPDAEIGGTRDISDAYLGTISNTGDYEFYARMNSLPTLLKAGIGSVASVAGSGATAGTNVHTFTPSDSAQLPFLSIEEAISAGFDAYTYADAVVNTLHLEVDAAGYLMGTVGIIAARRTTGVTPTDGATIIWDNTPMIVGSNVTVSYDGVQLPARSFNLDLNNNFESDVFLLGSYFLGDLTPKRRELTGGFTVREKDKDLWRASNLGAAAAVVPSGLPLKKQLVVTCNTYEFIGATTTTEQLVITVPKAIIKPYNLGVSGDDILETGLEWQAIRPAVGTPLFTLSVRNSLTAVV